MIKKSCFISFLLILIWHNLPAQAKPTIYIDLGEALEQPTMVGKYYLDCSEESDSAFFSNLHKFTNLKSLTIVGYTDQKLPTALFSSRSIENLCLSECTFIDFNDLFIKLPLCKQLKSLTIDECDLIIVPKEIIDLPELEKLVITNCDNLDLEISIENICLCRKLKYLGLPVNQICEIPVNIGKVTQIGVLDISNNVVFDLPESMALLNNLDTMNVEGNIFINAVNSLSKIKSLKIKYLSLDNDLSDQDRERLKKLFPNTKIVGIAPDNVRADTLAAAGGNPKDSIAYGTFRSVKTSGRIYSEAYIYFADFFRSLPAPPDTSLFDERYKNLSYANGVRLSAGMAYNWDNPRIYIWSRRPPKGQKRQIVFNFHKQKGKSKTAVGPVYNSELKAFNDMYWVYDGGLSRTDFFIEYVSSSRKSEYAWKRNNDCRIYYDDFSKTFTIELKNLRGFQSFKAHPLLENTLYQDRSKEQYLKRYTRYTQLLNNRRLRFNKVVIRDKADNNKARSMIIGSLWKTFSNNYFSREEKEMTKSQWLEYYDWVVGHEAEAFAGASVTTPLLTRYLTINKYIQNIGRNNLMYDTTAMICSVNFLDSEGNKLAVNNIFILNTLNKIYTSSVGSLGVDPNIISLNRSSNVAMILFLRNGDAGIVTPSQYARIPFSPVNEMDIKVTVFNAKLITFGQLFTEAGL
jgi:hypothetical protein